MIYHSEANPVRDPYYIFIDTSNRIQMFSINFATPRLYNQTSSDPIDFYRFDKTSIIAYSDYWDFWAFGVTQEIKLQG